MEQQMKNMDNDKKVPLKTHERNRSVPLQNFIIAEKLIIPEFP